MMSRKGTRGVVGGLQEGVLRGQHLGLHVGVMRVVRHPEEHGEDHAVQEDGVDEGKQARVLVAEDERAGAEDRLVRHAEALALVVALLLLELGKRVQLLLVLCGVAALHVARLLPPAPRARRDAALVALQVAHALHQRHVVGARGLEVVLRGQRLLRAARHRLLHLQAALAEAVPLLAHHRNHGLLLLGRVRPAEPRSAAAGAGTVVTAGQVEGRHALFQLLHQRRLLLQRGLQLRHRAHTGGHLAPQLRARQLAARELVLQAPVFLQQHGLQ
mmetsp:Transcript_37327/g.96869  ORF Transcript_37327/g.96869 Transcript_37327/m.96869 type:complete len:273 (-) Transcript_37327:25-843(-)